MTNQSHPTRKISFNLYVFDPNVNTFTPSAFKFGPDVFTFVPNSYTFGANVFKFVTSASFFEPSAYTFAPNVNVFASSVYTFAPNLDVFGVKSAGFEVAGNNLTANAAFLGPSGDADGRRTGLHPWLWIGATMAVVG